MDKEEAMQDLSFVYCAHCGKKFDGSDGFFSYLNALWHTICFRQKFGTLDISKLNGRRY